MNELIKIIASLWSPAGFTKRERLEYRLSALLCVGSFAVVHVMLIIFGCYERV